ncbi:glycoside hydrolase family 3 C-terminal domain-containing protein [Jiangella endophytica]|uniref:glycoside hydrolase family 3 C-terminal domain-containing protein n=1 Tax=Jiangella endophytica TaxID=1623398 RepID=UPI000E3492D8|nr:glycoside hydrolase family 3 C-terminal domain-containing protein [Jiangella endophytica]
MTPSREVGDHVLRPLAGKLTLEQKVRLLTGANMWSTHPEPAIGLRRVVVSDGPSGVRGETWDEGDPSLNLPSATALAATWDPAIAYRFGAVLAAEARRKGAHVVLGPTVNLHRSPLGGRHFEAYSEDPLLTSDLAAAYVRGVQDGGVGACPKHYVGNDAETDRYTVDVIVSDRALRELYLAAFEDTVVRERPWTVMAAYNGVNGASMTENPLLADPLCGEWGFDGVVISDWGAVYRTASSARARLDLEMPGPHGVWGERLVEAVRAGDVPEEAIDEKVVRLLRLAARVGALDGVDAAAGPGVVAAPGGAAFTRDVAAESAVLIRNAGVLPWDPAALRSVAVIGHHALVPSTQGGGSAMVIPPHVVSPLEGVRVALPDADVTWSLGALAQARVVPLPLDRLTDPESGRPGVRVHVFDEAGEIVRAERRVSADLSHLVRDLPPRAASLRLITRFRPAVTETAHLGVTAVRGVRLRLDGRLLIDEVLEPPAATVLPPSVSVPVELTADREVELVVETDLPEQSDHMPFWLVLGTDVGTAAPEDEVAAAVEAARAADVALVVVGTSPRLERETVDRTSLALPAGQDDLVRAVAAVNPRTVVVVNAGSPVLLPWRDDVAAVLLTWFGGQEYGHALADVLLGAREPGGRLPTTWPAAQADVPVLSTTPADGRLAYDEGIHVGYRAWLRSGAAPALPFGSGLGYTTWELGELSVPAAITNGDGVDVILSVTNTGARAGKHVVQVYLSRDDSAVDRPVRWLAGHAVVRAGAGAEQQVTVRIGARAFAHWTDAGWRTEPGTFTVHAGPHAWHLPRVAHVSVT